jgi:hypothetical protein
MSHDRSTIEAVVQHYFDGLYESDADKLAAIFHPSADLRWLEKGELQIACESAPPQRQKASRARISS